MVNVILKLVVSLMCTEFLALYDNNFFLIIPAFILIILAVIDYIDYLRKVEKVSKYTNDYYEVIFFGLLTFIFLRYYDTLDIVVVTLVLFTIKIYHIFAKECYEGYKHIKKSSM